eukprot:CAMPEP_0197538246 /NCGR_PEP_ID=MMETSP1318-20131121/59295_1 /TAXON_ID=552666 /ORGANISM="Partenskyella glossopodia, Strain RCC365" /LENGTH=148 /DNA_ID=CAMNT_0043096615 /DNA_START=365 /DNA_END=814 /DNA_ORIENTATION=-
MTQYAKQTRGSRGSNVPSKTDFFQTSAKTYETAIEQLLEKAFQDAREEDMNTRFAATSTRETRSRGSGEVRYTSNCEQGKRLNFSREQIQHLSRWFEDHVDDPYPSPNTKAQLARQSGLTFKQVSNWFINARSRRLTRDEKKALKRIY